MDFSKVVTPSQIKTAYSSHRVCFVCRAKYGADNRLRRVKTPDIMNAYRYFGMYIKKDSRCCANHLQENGLLKKEEFQKIPTRMKDINGECLNLLKMLSNQSTPIFEKFKDFKYVDEYECSKITGLSKIDFKRFAEMIKSVHNNQHRTKDQLIALYMFWLRNGTDQKSLAVMFGNKTSQRRISDYLKQIRVAISKDIVPKYLGANKNREEYLQYNTKMTNKLFQLADDDLVIVVDGTYCSIEKSNNNSFQYSTYSCQQKDSLFKPFLVCCADGYIIDMYGPFAANDNDATIFDYIYNNDEDLKRILVPQKTLILMDKGKTADIHKINDY